LELLDRAVSDSSFLGNVITGDEAWVYGYDPETRVQSSRWKSPSSRLKKSLQTISNIKLVMIVFCDLDGIVRDAFNNNNNIYYYYYYYKLQLGCHPVTVVILHVNQT